MPVSDHALLITTRVISGFIAVYTLLILVIFFRSKTQIMQSTGYFKAFILVSITYMLLSMVGQAMTAVIPDSAAKSTYTDYVTYYGTEMLVLLLYWLYFVLMIQSEKAKTVLTTIGTCLIVFYVAVSYVLRDDPTFLSVRTKVVFWQLMAEVFALFIVTHPYEEFPWFLGRNYDYPKRDLLV
jgi:hypothetical protein